MVKKKKGIGRAKYLSLTAVNQREHILAKTMFHFDVRRKATAISIPEKSFTTIRYIPFPLDKIGHGISRGDVSSTVTGKTSSLLKNFLSSFLSFPLSSSSSLTFPSPRWFS